MERSFSYFKKSEQWFPVIDIFIKGPGVTDRFKALVDSGAAYSVFRADVAEHLGVNIKIGKEIFLQGIGGRILGYLHNLEVGLDETNFFRCKIIFSEEFTVSFNILGRDNFFLPFLITFNEREKILILQEDKK
jgi:hypothetical protein